MERIIDIRELSFGYQKDREVLHQITCEIMQGENVGIVGANGVGKSTLLRLLVGLESGYSGALTVAGIPVEKKRLREVRKYLGFVFQDADSQMFLTTVRENVAFGPANYGVSGEALEACVQKALEQLRIAHLADRPIYQLSGGEKKLASIATVLSMEPEVLLLDEPTVTLDPRNRRNLIRILQELPQTKLIASHDLDFIADTCDRTLLFAGGKLVRDGWSREVLFDAALMERCGLELPLSAGKKISS